MPNAARTLSAFAVVLFLWPGAAPDRRPVADEAAADGSASPPPPTLASSGPAGAAPTGASSRVVPPADHHFHVWSPMAVDALIEGQRAAGQTVIPEDEARPLGAEEAMAALDSAGIRRAVLLSTAYFFGFPELEFEDERAKVRAENDYVARQVAARPDRLVGFCSFNPNADYALEELARCGEVPELAGVKLHLANSDFDYRDPAQVDRLREVFREANARGMPIVIHMRTRREGFGRREVETFLDEVLPAAPDIPVQVAHLGGKGGYDEGVQEAVEAFAAAFEDHPERTDRVFFDLSGVPVPPSLAKGDSALLERVRQINERVAGAVRLLGPDRIVYGTDWPAVSSPLYLEGMPPALPLEPGTVRDLLDDAAPYLEAGGSMERGGDPEQEADLERGSDLERGDDM